MPGTLLVTAFILRRLTSPLMSGQDSFFPNGLPPQGAGPVQLVRWLPTLWRGFVATPLLWQYPFAVLLLVVGGLVALVVRGRGVWAAMLGATFAVAVVGGPRLPGRGSGGAVSGRSHRDADRSRD